MGQESREERLQRIAARVKQANCAEFEVFVVEEVCGSKMNAGADTRNKKIYFAEQLVDRMTDDDLAGVLGHEVGHVVNQDGQRISSYQGARCQEMRGILRDANNEMKAEGNGKLRRGFTLAGASALMLGITVLSSLAFKRHYEQEADDFSVDAAGNAGYDPAANANALRKLDPKGAESCFTMGTVISTHPATGARIERIIKKAAEAKQKK